jgi:hypothetical protein
MNANAETSGRLLLFGKIYFSKKLTKVKLRVAVFDTIHNSHISHSSSKKKLNDLTTHFSFRRQRLSRSSVGSQ